MEYYVIAPDGQRFGPAGIATLNQWIQEGRIAPHTLLQDSQTNAQVAARALPALSFAPPPSLAPPGANPYTVPNPVQPPNYYPASPAPSPGMSSGHLTAAWLATVFAGPFVPFCWVGVVFTLFGLISSVQLWIEGRKGAGGAMLAINLAWVGLFVASRAMNFL